MASAVAQAVKSQRTIWRVKAFCDKVHCGKEGIIVKYLTSNCISILVSHSMRPVQSVIQLNKILKIVNTGGSKEKWKVVGEH